MTTTESALAALDHLYSWVAPVAANRKSYDTLRAFIEGAGEDAERWRLTKRCTRIGQHGDFHVFPDDAVDFEGIAGQMLEREIDAARAAAKPAKVE